MVFRPSCWCNEWSFDTDAGTAYPWWQWECNWRERIEDHRVKLKDGTLCITSSCALPEEISCVVVMMMDWVGCRLIGRLYRVAHEHKHKHTWFSCNPYREMENRRMAG